jgi:hypothetical protein
MRWVYDQCDAGHCPCQDHGGENWVRCCRCGSILSLEDPTWIWDSRSPQDSPDTGYDFYAAFMANREPDAA